jgi:hypothetical protein
LATDPDHCGGCDIVCPEGEACVEGECSVDCGGDEEVCARTCIDTDADPANCGGCDIVCTQRQTRENGTCTCLPELDQCGDDCALLETDVNHCGECDVRCDPGFGCHEGVCEPPDDCEDPCGFDAGISWGCGQRFMYGINFAWHHFSGDFGGIGAWGQPGVSENPDVEADLAEMAEHGASVIRWWVWPQFRGGGVEIDAEGTPVGLRGTVLADLDRALELADRYDLYLMLCLFSFDNFVPSSEGQSVRVYGMKPIALDPDLRSALIDEVVRPLARAAEASPYRDHLIAWDAINEPEWAMQGASKYGGDEPFTPTSDQDPISHDEMETFVSEVIAGLRAESTALVTVGGTGMKWRHAWTQVDIDFYQVHIYDWLDEHWPCSNSPSFYDLTDEPVVMGEFPTGGLSSAKYPELLESWFINGYAGALSWDYNSNRGQLSAVADFAEAHACETTY